MGSLGILANRYNIEKVAGRGGTSVVYKAYDIQAENAVRAIKEISMRNADLYAMAKLESQLIKELYEKDKSNAFLPNIIHQFEIGDKCYIVQDFLDGESMDDMLSTEAMPYQMFIESAKQICSFMKFFHSSTGRVHSDMKPENIMVLRPTDTLNDNNRSVPTVKLKFIDFGTAIRIQSGVTGYTPEYAAPEQYREIKLDERTDIFNIGATFFHMITGKKPGKVSNGERLLVSEERFKFDRNVNAEIKRIIQKCTKDDPDDRYRNCDALYKDIAKVEKHSNLRLIAAAATAAVICFTGFGISSYMANSLGAKNNSENYSLYVNQGNYEQAIRIDGTNRDDIYSKLIESYTSDEKLTSDEDNGIINLIKAKDAIKQTDDNYGRMMYEIGNAYWLYYYPNDDDSLDDLELEKDRINSSYEWFEKAVNDSRFRQTESSLYERTSIFYNIGKFYSEIDRRERDGTDDVDFYSSMWENIVEFSDYINDSNEVTSARVCQTLLSLISRYSVKFRQSGCTEDEQSAILDKVEKRVYSGKNMKFTNTYSMKIAENFEIGTVRKKIEMAYAD